MGTSGIVHFHEEGVDSPIICHVYKQSDGYPQSLGEQLKDVFGEAKLVNGIRFDVGNQVNGMGCAAAQFIAHTKDRAGGIYMLREAKDWSDFDYHVFHDGQVPEPQEEPGKLSMKIMSRNDVVWQGEISSFDSAALFEDELET